MRTRLDVSGIDFNIDFTESGPDRIAALFEACLFTGITLMRSPGCCIRKDLLPFLDRPADFDWHTA